MTTADNDPTVLIPHDRTPLALLGVAIAFIGFDCFDAWKLSGIENQFIISAVTGVMAFQMVLLGIWIAIGAGSIWMRLMWAVPLYVLRCALADWIAFHNYTIGWQN